jgi:hypothetical protein
VEFVPLQLLRPWPLSTSGRVLHEALSGSEAIQALKRKGFRDPAGSFLKRKKRLCEDHKTALKTKNNLAATEY